MTETPLLEVLQRISLFREVAPERLERIAVGARRVHVGRGETLFHKGDPADGFYYVIQGRVKIVVFSPQGDEKVIEIMREGMSFGEAVMFIGEPYPATAQTMTDCHLVFIARDPLVNELHRDPELGMAMLAGMSRRLHGIVRDIESYSLDSSTQRVIGYLLGEAERLGFEAGACELQLPAAKGVIASRLNITPETLSRIFSDLSKRDLITVDARRITLHDIGRLKGVEA